MCHENFYFNSSFSSRQTFYWHSRFFGQICFDKLRQQCQFSNLFEEEIELKFKSDGSFIYKVEKNIKNVRIQVLGNWICPSRRGLMIQGQYFF